MDIQLVDGPLHGQSLPDIMALRVVVPGAYWGYYSVLENGPEPALGLKPAVWIETETPPDWYAIIPS